MTEMNNEDAQKLCDITDRFRRGDHITDSEVQLMLQAIKDAMPFLWMSPDYTLARRQAFRDQNLLENMVQERALHKVFT